MTDQITITRARPRHRNITGSALRLYELMVRCADGGVCCPTSDELADYLDCRSNNIPLLVRTLVERGYITSETHTMGRTVTIVESGRSTPDRTTRKQLGFPGQRTLGIVAGPDDRRQRACLSCGKAFMSEHRFNRVCGCLSREGIFT